MKNLNLVEGISAIVFETEGVCVVNTTPHNITMMDTSGEVVDVPTSVLVNAKTVEEQVSPLFVETRFVGTEEGIETITMIEEAFANTGRKETLVIVGSIIAAQAYPGKIVAMTPCPGYERVAPTEKRMNCNKFTVFS